MNSLINKNPSSAVHHLAGGGFSSNIFNYQIEYCYFAYHIDYINDPNSYRRFFRFKFDTIESFFECYKGGGSFLGEDRIFGFTLYKRFKRWKHEVDNSYSINFFRL